MAFTSDPVETRGIAIAGMSLGYALVGILKRTGALDPEAIEDTFEAALSSVENALSPDDRSAALARQLLDLMGERLAMHVKPLNPPPTTDERELESLGPTVRRFTRR